MAKPKGPDKSLIAKQKKQLADQEAELEKQRLESEAEAERQRDARIGRQKALRGRLAGSRSLITNQGGELGTSSSLG